MAYKVRWCLVDSELATWWMWGGGDAEQTQDAPRIMNLLIY